MQKLNAVREQWKLDLVTAVHTGPDGRVMQAHVSYKITLLINLLPVTVEQSIRL